MCPRELTRMQVQAAIQEPRFNRFRCVHRDLVFRGGPSDSVWILFGFFWILFRFFSRGVSRRPFETTIKFCK